MALNGSFGLGVVFDFVNRGMQGILDTDRAFGNLHRNISTRSMDVGSALHKMGIAFAGIGMAAAPLMAFKSLADRAGEFELGLAKVRNVSGATSEELVKLRRAAIDAGIATQFSPTQAVEGLQNMASLGFTVNEQLTTLIPTLDFAAGQSLSVADAATIAGAAMKIYGIGVDDAGFALDRLTKISNLTAIQSTDLQVALANSAKGAIAGKQGLTEMLVTMGLAKNAGLDMSVVANSVNRALLSMSTTGKATFDELGIAVANDKGQFRDFGDILLDLAAKTEHMSDVQRAKTLDDALGTFGMTASLAVMEQLKNGVTTASGEILKGGDALAYLRQQLQNSTGTMAQFRDNIQNTFEGQKVLLQGTMETIGIVLGEPLAKVFGPAVKLVTDTLNKFLYAFDQLPAETKSGIVQIVLAASAFVGLVSAFAASKAILGLLIPLLSAFKLSLLGLGLGTILPLLPIILLMRDHWSEVKLVLKSFIDILTTGQMSSAMEQELEKAENQGVRAFVLAAQEGFASVRTAIKETTGFLMEHKEVVEMVVIAYAAALGTYGSAVKIITALTVAWRWAQWQLNLAMVANPAGLAIAGIIAVVAMVAYRWKRIKTEWIYLVSVMKEGFSLFVDFIKIQLGFVMDMIIKAARMIPEKFQVGPIKTLAQMQTTQEKKESWDKVAPALTTGPSRRAGPRNRATLNEDDWGDVYDQDPMESLPMVVRSGALESDAKRRWEASQNEAWIRDALREQANIPIETHIALELDGDKIAGMVHRRTKDGEDEMFMDEPEYAY